mmetsp:Transcript_54486/g.129890  ORF Transcript_54486/g.129890 Transcript_54486/m.129890 type:complete len:105 (+) Transcript_54486:1443-1757(+)
MLPVAVPASKMFGQQPSAPADDATTASLSSSGLTSKSYLFFSATYTPVQKEIERTTTKAVAWKNMCNIGLLFDGRNYFEHHTRLPITLGHLSPARAADQAMSPP